jgi:predicted ATP-grasp superfamily ATP-dependent carboligase
LLYLRTGVRRRAVVRPGVGPDGAFGRLARAQNWHPERIMGATAFVLTHRSTDDPHAWCASLQALAIARSLGRRGVRVVRLHPGTRELSLASRYCWRAEHCPNVHESEPALLRFLLDAAGKYEGVRVLIPASDDTAWFLGRHREALGRSFRVVAPDADTVATIIDKRRQYEAARSLGIPIPATYYPHDLAEAQALARTLKRFPYIIKPNVAHRWRLARVRQRMRTPGTKAVVVRNAEELVAEYRAIARFDRDLMVQRVIGGPDSELYGFFGYFDRDSRPLGYCVRRKIRQLPLGFGYCTLIESCREDRVVSQSVHLLQGLGFHGIVGVEWKRDPDTGEPLLLEVNARATNTTALPPACGVDLPAIAFADAIGEQVAPVTQWRAGVKWVWLAEDVWAARALGLGPLEWLRSLRGEKVGAVYAADDLRPALLEAAAFVRATLGRRLRRFRPAPHEAAPAAR